MQLWQQLRERKLVQWALAYVAGAFALLQGVDIVAQQFAWPEALQRGITLALVLGFFVTLLLAWYHGERGVQRVSGTELLLLTLLLGIGGVLLWRYSGATAAAGEADDTHVAATSAPSWSSDPASERNPKSVAVLPFTSIGGGQEEQYFAEGLSEEVINSLSRVPDLQVAGRTSSFAFRNTEKTIPQIAADLGVATVLEGSSRQSGSRLRITAQLVRAADGFELWSETYDRSSDDVIAIQEDVARSIATALKTATDPEALKAMQRAGTRSVPAYQAYLKALALVRTDRWKNGDVDGAESAVAFFRQAIEIDPGFSDAYARLATLQLGRLRPSAMGSPEVDSGYADRLKAVRGDLDQASSLARTPAERSYYAALLASVDQQYVEALRLMADYVRAYPGNRRALTYMSDWSLYVGKYEDARDWTEKVAQLADADGPLEFPVQNMVWARDFKRAGEMARRWLELDPLMAISPTYQVHRGLLSDGDVSGAARLIPRLLESNLPDASKELATFRQACAEGRIDEARAIMARTAAAARPDQSVYWHELTLLGQDDEATALLAHMDTPALLNALSSYLTYPQFDVTRFPHLKSVLDAQGIHRPPPRLPPFACVHDGAR